MTDNCTKLTYKEIVESISGEIPFENLKTLSGLVPEKIINKIEKEYWDIIDNENFDMAFDEFVGIIILNGVATTFDLSGE